MEKKLIKKIMHRVFRLKSAYHTISLYLGSAYLSKDLINIFKRINEIKQK